MRKECRYALIISLNDRQAKDPGWGCGILEGIATALWFRTH